MNPWPPHGECVSTNSLHFWTDADYPLRTKAIISHFHIPKSRLAYEPFAVLREADVVNA